MAEQIEIWALSDEGCYFPVKIISVESLCGIGFQPKFMLRFPGQMLQLTSPPPDSIKGMIPHLERPVQPANSATGGCSGLLKSTEHEKVTVFFAIGQSNVLSIIEPSSGVSLSQEAGAAALTDGRLAAEQKCQQADREQANCQRPDQAGEASA